MFTRAWFAKIPHMLILKYSFLGLIAVPLGVCAGFWKLGKFILVFCLLVAGTFLYVAQHFLSPYERWNESDHPDTKRFLAIYRRRRDVDDRIKLLISSPSVVPATKAWTVGPLAEELISDAGRVFALALVLLFAFSIGMAVK